MQVQPGAGYGSLQVPAATPSSLQRLSVPTVPGTPGSLPPATFGNYQMPPGTPRSFHMRPGSLQVPAGAIQHAQAVPAFAQTPVEIYSGYRNASSCAGNSTAVPGSPVLPVGRTARYPAGISPARGDAKASPSGQCRNTTPRSRVNGSPSARSGMSVHHSPWNKSTDRAELEWLVPQKESELKPSSPRVRNRESFKAHRDRALVPDVQRRKDNEGSRSPSRGGDEGNTSLQMTKTVPWVEIQTVRLAEKELRYPQPSEINKSFVNSLRSEEPDFMPSLITSPELSPVARNETRMSSASRERGMRAGSDTPRNTAAPRVPARGAGTPRGSATPRGYATPRGAPTTRTACRA